MLNNRIKIGVVEDEGMMAQLICHTLSSLGYDITEPVSSYEAALVMIEEEKPDILLLDILLDGEKDGIDLAETVRENYKIPFIFLTSSSDKDTLARAKKVNPPAYLIKPFNNEELYCAIEICLNNYSKQVVGIKKDFNEPFNDTLFIKDGHYFNKIKFDDIYYIESDHVYINIHLATKKLIVRISLNSFFDTLNQDIFVRIHRSYVVNINHIDSIGTDHVMIKGLRIPSNRRHRDEILQKFQVI